MMTEMMRLGIVPVVMKPACCWISTRRQSPEDGGGKKLRQNPTEYPEIWPFYTFHHYYFCGISNIVWHSVIVEFISMSTCRLEECEGNKGRTPPSTFPATSSKRGPRGGGWAVACLTSSVNVVFLEPIIFVFPLILSYIQYFMSISDMNQSFFLHSMGSYLLVYPVDRFCVSFTLVTLYHVAFGRALDPHALLWHVFPPALEL